MKTCFACKTRLSKTHLRALPEKEWMKLQVSYWMTAWHKELDRANDLQKENAELVKFIEQCAEDRYARVACLDWVRKNKKCSKP